MERIRVGQVGGGGMGGGEGGQPETGYILC